MDIRTPRLHLRPLTPADAKAVHEFRCREEVMQWSMKKTPDRDLDETEAWVSKALSVPNHVFVVTESQSPSDRIIGTIGLRFMELPFASSEGKPRRWELGYQFHPDVWGRGYATEAARGVIEAWRRGEIARLEQEGEWAGTLHAATDKENEASQRVLRKVGFERAREFVDPMGMECVDYKLVG